MQQITEVYENNTVNASTWRECFESWKSEELNRSDAKQHKVVEK